MAQSKPPPPPASTEKQSPSITANYVAIPRLINTHKHLPPSSISSSSAAAIEASRWQAVRTRSPISLKNPFVYGVRSTRIYCKPNCPARLARRANIEYFDTPAAAAKAGYRACKRCKPDSVISTSSTAVFGGGPTTYVIEGETSSQEGQVQKVAKACETITSAVLGGGGGGSVDEQQQKHRPHRPPSLRQLAAEVGLTPFHFHRVFKKVVGVTPRQYALNIAASATKKGTGATAEDGSSPAAVGHYISPASEDMINNNSIDIEEEDTHTESIQKGQIQEIGISDYTFDDLIDWDWDEELRLSSALIDIQA